MVNTVAFSKRLKQVIAHYGLSAASFSEAINVNRSSISHLLSGRNKPSLDFVLKVIQAFPEVELYWLLNGKGEFPSKETPIINQPNKEDVASLVQESSFKKSAIITPSIKEDQNTQIERIVIFYEDGTFSTYKGK